MFELTITELAPLGDYDETYGQRYWGKGLDDDKPISFNSMDKELGTKLVHAGTLNIVCETKTLKKSAKGTLYWQLKKVKPLETHTSPVQPSEPQASVSPTSAPQTAPKPLNELQVVVNMLESADARLQSIEAKVDKLMGLDTVAEVPEGEVNLDDIPY